MKDTTKKILIVIAFFLLLPVAWNAGRLAADVTVRIIQYLGISDYVVRFFDFITII